MNTPREFIAERWKQLHIEWKVTFVVTWIVALLVHLPVMIGDYPNHDGLASMYFDQNMITSGRWFLIAACSPSSWYAMPWIIGLLASVYLAIAAVALVAFLEIRDSLMAALTGCLLVTFPVLASTYAYIFTADGYMCALMLVMVALLVTHRYGKGFVAGGICLAFSMGIYQSYLAFAIILALFGAARALLGSGAAAQMRTSILHYVYMGVIGVGLYYVILQILLKVEGKALDTYQGINDMTSTGGASLISRVGRMYTDFVAFTLRGNVLYNNMLSLAALIVLAVTACYVLIVSGRYRKISTWVTFGLLAVLIPPATNMILMISPNVTYHLLMRYQWILLPIGILVWCLKAAPAKQSAWVQWICLAAVAILCLNYAVTDNIAYYNLEKKYEKTYAYCLRLADRMEQTEGYYQGIPVAMVGVQSAAEYPETDITGDVTSNMIGMTGDYLVYTDTNYQAFMQHYLGITINLVSDEEMERIYHTEEYQALDSFPGANSMKVVDGILYIKTE